MALRRLVERRGDHLAVHRPLHVGDFFGPLVDQQDDQVHLGVVERHRLRDALQEHRLAGARRRDDQAALPLPDRRHQVHHAARQVVGLRLELALLLRVERREVLEEQLVAGLLGRLEVDGLDLDQGEVPLPFLGRPDLARHGVAGLQVELADLRRRDVDVVGTGQVVVVGRPEEPEPVGQHFEHALREDVPALLGLRLQDLEDQLLLSHAGGAGDVEILGDLGELLDAHVLQFADVEAFARTPRLGLGRVLGFGRGRGLSRHRRGLAVGPARRHGLALVVAWHSVWSTSDSGRLKELEMRGDGPRGPRDWGGYWYHSIERRVARVKKSVPETGGPCQYRDSRDWCSVRRRTGPDPEDRAGDHRLEPEGLGALHDLRAVRARD